MGTVNVSNQDWSPSGNAILFHEENSYVNGTTYVADLSGGGATFFSLGQVWAAAWSPLGNRIAYSNGEIWTINPDGSSPARITLRIQTKTETRSQSTPSWSPDGRVHCLYRISDNKIEVRILDPPHSIIRRKFGQLDQRSKQSGRPKVAPVK